jgi:peptidoglycan hydrolase-like protein with peptidoglycan-binding domain
MSSVKYPIFGIFGFVLIASTCLGSLPAHAQTPPSPPPPVDAAQDRAKRAFEAMSEGERKAVQDALIWTGDYKGIADGRFGKGTHDAIAAFALRSKLPGDGSLDEKGRAALAAAALRAKTAVRFSVVTDERTGIKIGVPLKLLSKNNASKDGTRYATPDNNAALETSFSLESEATLEQRFDTLRAETAQRKVTYKVSRPDFFVVVGEMGGTIFYTRFTRGEEGGEKRLVGYTLTYPAAAKATYDMIAIAVANSFEPFAGKPQVAVAEPAVADVAPAKPYLAANGLIVGSGLVLTSLPAQNCREAQIGARGVKIAQQEKSNGLTLLEAANVLAPAVHLHSGELKVDLPLVVLAYAGKTAVPADDTKPHEDLVAAPGQLRPGVAGMRVVASGQGVRAGTIVFDRSGALVGLLSADANAEKHIGDVVPSTHRALIDTATLVGFLGPKRPKEADSPAVAAAERSLGDIVAANRAVLVPVYCVP